MMTPIKTKNKILSILLTCAIVVQSCVPGAWLGSVNQVYAADTIPSANNGTCVAAPVINTTEVPSSSLLGQTVSFRVHFANNGSEIGYLPYVDMLLPSSGVEYNQLVYAGLPLDKIVLNPGTGSTVTHPYAIDGSGNHIVYNIGTGNILVVAKPPFGSYAAGVTQDMILALNVTGNSNFLGVPLSVDIRGGYALGCNLNNQQSSIGSFKTNTITPSNIILNKGFNGVEDETVGGGNFTKTYTILGDIANNTTINDLVITDELPLGLMYSGVTVFPGGATIVEPTPNTVTASGNNLLEIHFGSMVGTPSSQDIRIDVDFFVADSVVLGSGSQVGVSNTATAFANGNTGVAIASDDTAFSAKSIAIQKYGANMTSGHGLTQAVPGDAMEYTLQFQISDYFSFTGIVISDILPDGLELDTGVSPTFSIDTQSGSYNGIFALGNTYNIDFSQVGHDDNPATNGSKTVSFDVSKALVGQGGDAYISGGVVGGAKGTITYRANIQTSYTDIYSGNELKIGDALINNATIEGDILHMFDMSLGSHVTDITSESVQIGRQNVSKVLYAINGSTTGSFTTIKPGDVVTYRVKYELPTTDTASLILTDYVPYPTFQLSGFSVAILSGTPGDIPPANVIGYGVDDTLHSLGGLTGTILPGNGGDPIVSIDTVNNTITLDYGFIEDPLNRASTVDLLISVEVSDSPLPDNTPLTNLISSNQGGYTSTSNTFGVQTVKVLQPDVKIRKGIVATSNNNSAFTIDPFFTGFDENNVTLLTPVTTENSNGYFNADLNNVQSGDIVRFVILLDNKGNSEKGAFDITLSDNIIAGLQIPSSGMNLHIINGIGTGISYTKPDGSPAVESDLFGSGIKLDDKVVTGSLTDAGISGQNIAMIFYDMEVTDVYAGMQFANNAEITHFANMEGGANFISFARKDSAILKALAPTIQKSFMSSDQVFSTGNNVVIGETITYNVDIVIPNNVTLSGFDITDTLDPGLAFSGFVSITGINILAPADLQDIINTATITPVDSTGQQITLDFNNVAVSGINATGLISLQYDVIVLNTGSNSNNTIRYNTAVAAWVASSSGDVLSATGGANIRIIEPLLTINKTRPAPSQGSRIVTYTLTVGNNNPSQSTGYDALITDQLDARLTYVPGSFSGNGWTGFDESAAINSGIISYSYDVLPLGGTKAVSFQAYLTTGINITTNNVPNTALLSRSSIPGSGINSGMLTGERISTHSSSINTDFILNPILTKSLVSTSEATTSGTGVAIGEVVTYRLRTRIYEDMVHSGFMIIDPLPNGLSFSGVTSFYASGNLVSSLGAWDNMHPAWTPTVTSTGIVFNFGTLSNPDLVSSSEEYIDITFEALVLNISSNLNNILIQNQAYTRQNSSGSLWTDTAPTAINAAAVRIVEPWIALTKSVVTPPTTGNRLVTYQVTLTNTGTALGHEVEFYDTLPASMSYVSGSLQHTSGVLYTSSNISGNRIEFGYDTMSVGTTSTIRFQALLNTGEQVSQSITNTGYVERTGLPGTRIAERICSGLPVNYYCNASAIITPFNLTPQMTKEIVGYSGPFAIGDEVRYQLTIVLGENGNRSGLTVSDIADTGIILTGVTATFVAPTLYSTIGNINTIPAVMNASGFFIDLGNVTNNSAAPATIVYQYTGIVSNITGNQAGQIRGNTSAVDWNNTSGWSASTGFIIGEPNIVLGKSANYVTGSRFITYTISLLNTGAYTTTGYNIALTDVLSGTHYVTGSLTHVSGVPYTGSMMSGDMLSFDYDHLGVGASSSFSFAVELDESVLSGALVSNTVTGVWSSLSRTGGRSYVISTGIDTSTFIISDLGISKAVTGTSNISGGVVTYTITYWNSSANATQATIIDTLPLSGFTYMGSSPSGTLSGNQIIWTPQVGSGTTGSIIVTGVLNGTVSGNITNSVSIVGLSNDVNLSNNSDTASYQSLFASDLIVHKTTTAGPVLSSGATVVYTITRHNAGPNSTTGKIVDNWPSTGISLVDFTTGGSYTGNTITWDLVFPANTTGILMLTGIINGSLSGVISNSAVISSDTLDINTGNNISIATGNAYFVSDLSVGKTISSVSHRSGDVVTYTITWHNAGPNGTTGIIVDTWPLAGLNIIDAGLGYVSGSQSSGLQIIWSGYFAANTTGTYVVTGIVNVSTPMSIVNAVTISGNNLDLYTDNNRTSVTSNIASLGGWGGGGYVASNDAGGKKPENDTKVTNTGSLTTGRVDKTIFNPSIENTCFTPFDNKTIYQGNAVTQMFRIAHQMLYSYQLTKRRGTADYRPFDALTREEAARFMVEFAEKVLCRKKTYVYNDQFNDIVGADPTLIPFIKESYEYAIFRGDNWNKGNYPTTFRPKEVISRDEFVAIVIRLVTNDIKDSDGEDWAREYRQLLEQLTKTHTLGADMQRGNSAETIYSIYRDNDYSREEVGYVVVY